jgi:hypothetical protein
LGSLLGDSSLELHKGYKNARFSFRHSAKQEEYFNWKVGELKEISGENCVWRQEGKDGWGQDKLRYQSLALEELTRLYQLTHPHGHLKIRRKWLNQLTALSLCVWWLDDGSLVSNCRQGVLCTDGFSFEELLIAVKYFRKVWQIEFRIGKVSTKGPRANQYRLWLRSREELKKFLRIILPSIPVPSMLPKVLILYKDPELQERWISEVCQLSKFERRVVEPILQKRKTALAHYRE